MCHQIDTVHWFTGLAHPRSVAANGGIYLWKDGRKNFDTMTCVFDYGPLERPEQGFPGRLLVAVHQLGRRHEGDLLLERRRAEPRHEQGDAQWRHDRARSGRDGPEGEPARREQSLEAGGPVETSANTGDDPMTTAHVRNWMECVRSRKQRNAPVEAGYQHAIATIMANAAARTGLRVTFDEKAQEVIAGGKVFQYLSSSETGVGRTSRPPFLNGAARRAGSRRIPRLGTRPSCPRPRCR